MRGVETDYTSGYASISISEKKDVFTRFFNYIEPYFAMLLAIFIILTVSYGFPFWITPVTLVLVILFMAYSYNNIETKGRIFIGITYTLLILVAIFLIKVLFLRLFGKK